MKKILILGGSVFIGKAIAKMFIEKENDVYILNRGNHPCPKGAKQLIANRNSIEQLKVVLANHRFDVVIDGSSYLPEQTKIVLSLLSGLVNHFIHLSSAAVYVDNNIFPYTEESQRGTSTNWGDYSTNKYLCEELLFSEWEKNKFPMTIIRPFYVYGPGNNLNRESYVFARILNKKTIVIPGMGIPMVQFGHIDDLCSAINKISESIDSVGKAYNVSGREYLTLKGWIEICGKVLDIKPKMLLVDTKSTGFKSRDWFPFRDINMIGSCEKIKNDICVEPKYSIFKGLKHTVNKIGRQKILNSLKINDVEKKILEKIGIK